MSASENNYKEHTFLVTPTNSSPQKHRPRFKNSFNYVLKKAGYFDEAQPDPYETYMHLVSKHGCSQHEVVCVIDCNIAI